MATRTYAVGTKAGARRLDDLTTPWVDIPVLLEPFGFPITPILRDVMTDPLDNEKVFVVGDRDTNSGATGVYISDSAGAVWYQPGGDIADLGSLLFYTLWEVWVVDSNVIYTCGQGGVLYKSIDAGATFDLVPVLPTPTGSFDGSGDSKALHFITDQIGVVAFESYVLKTLDGGSSWTVLNGAAPISVSTPIVGIHMSADEQTLTAVTPREILHSTDGGASWSIVDTFLLGGTHLTWVDDTNLFAFGSGNNRKVSSDGGATWTTLTVPDLSGPEHVAGHMFNLLDGFYDQNFDTMRTEDGLAFGYVSETAPYQIQAIWTHVDPPVEEPCGCPEGTTYNPITEVCEGFVSMAATNTGVNYTVGPGNQILNYGSSGSWFYENIDSKPYPIRLDGSTVEDDTNIPLAIDATVVNDAWGDVGTPVDTLNGRLNVAGIWTTEPISGSGDQLPTNKWIGFTACVETPVAKQYYIGIGGDNQVRIRVNGTTVVNFLYNGGDPYSFLRWHMFPITLPAGTNFVELEGWNNNDFAAFGAEIYDADLATLTAMTTPAQVETVLVFSTKDKIGGTFDIGSDVGWECPEGWELSFCDGYPQCVQQVQAQFEPCNCYLATNCEDPLDQMLLTTEDPLDLSLTYIFFGHPDKCWTVEVSIDCPPNDVITEVATSWATCEACIGVCYTLIDCEGVEPPIQVSNDLSEYLDPFGVGRIVRLTRCPEVCWQIVANPGHCTGAEEVVIITEDFETCEECAGVEPEIPLVLNHRKVKPGYDTPGCSAEYTEKVLCSFSESLYQEVISERYGIEFCCELDAQKWEIKHEDLKLRMIFDPDACIETTEDCCPPCNVEAEINLPCPEPDYVIGRITID